MSVVAAIKHEGKIYIGADSQATKGGSRSTLRNPNNYKVWKVSGSDHCLMAQVGDVRDGNVVRLMSDIVDDYDEYYDRVNYRFVVKYLVPEIVKNLKNYNYVKMNDDYLEYINSSFLFAYKDKLFLINSDCAVIEIEDYVAIGSGAQEAIGSLLSTEGEEPYSRIVKAIKASAASDIYVDYPIVMSDTDSTEFRIVNENNKEEIKAKGR